jgi:hypothetical protein
MGTVFKLRVSRKVGEHFEQLCADHLPKKGSTPWSSLYPVDNKSHIQKITIRRAPSIAD